MCKKKNWLIFVTKNFFHDNDLNSRWRELKSNYRYSVVKNSEGIACMLLEYFQNSHFQNICGLLYLHYSAKTFFFFFIIYIFPKKQRVSQNLGEYITCDLFTRMIKMIKRKVRTHTPWAKNKEPGAKEEESVLYLQSGLFYYLTTI